MGRFTIGVAAFLPGAAALLLWGCGRGVEDGATGAGAGRRAVVIGIDSADWTIIDDLVARGEMPHMARLMERGARGDLLTLRDIPLSPVVWTSVVTGKGPSKHGVTWFLVDQPDGSRTPVRSTNREAEALWTIADDQGLSSAVVGWWATYPAETLRHGVVASDALGFHGFGTTGRSDDPAGKVSPPELLPRFDGMIPPEHQVSHDFAARFIDVTREEWDRERYDPARGGRRIPVSPIQLFQQYAVTARGYTDIAKALLAEDAYDLTLVYYEQTDSFAHLFMKYAPPRLPWVSDHGVRRYGRIAFEWYRYQDELLGELLAEIDLETTALFIVSDHGFKTGDRRIKSDRTVDVKKAHLDHEDEGVFLAVGPGIRAGARIEGASVLDVTPTVLHYLGVEVGKDMDGRVLTEAFAEDLMDAHPVRYVATHETNRERVLTAAAATDADDQRDVLLGLQALGYIGPADPELAALEGGESRGETAASDLAPASSPELHNNRGRLHLGRGAIDEALAEFQAALAIDAENADALLAIGSVRELQGNAAEALRFAERALAADPDSVGALAAIARVRCEAGELQEAARLYRAALAITDASPMLHVGLGDVLHRAGNVRGAIRSFEAALALDPDDRAAHYNLGVSSGALGRTDDALKSYRAAIALDPDHPQAAAAHNNIGSIQRAAGDVDAALASFETAAALSPAHLESRFNAAIIHLDRDEAPAAVERLEQAARIAPNHEQVITWLGLARLQTGELESARRSLTAAHRLYPRNWRAAVGLAVIRALEKRDVEARALLDEARVAAGSADVADAFARSYEILHPLLPARALGGGD